MKLKRIQRKRTKGWRMPPNTMCVTRPGPHGNRYVIGETIEHVDRSMILVRDATHAKQLFAEWVEWQMAHFKTMADGIRYDLGGRNIACWCGLCPEHAAGKPLGVTCADCPPCHGDVWLELANAPPLSPQSGER